MLITYVGLPGAGKSLWNSYVAYTELTRIYVTEGLWKKKWYQLAYTMRSYYDYVVLNSDFNDNRGNWVKWIYNSASCTCEEDEKDFSFVPHWEYGGRCLGATDFEELYNPLKMKKKMLKVFPKGVALNCLCLFDESGTTFANTDWDKMPEDYRDFLTQHRKNITDLPMRFDIFVYTQHKDLIEVTLRRISYRIYLIRPLFGFAKNPLRPNFLNRIPGIKIYLYQRHEVLESRAVVTDIEKELDPEDQLESIERIDWYIFGKKYQNAYDTLIKAQKVKRVKTKV